MERYPSESVVKARAPYERRPGQGALLGPAVFGVACSYVENAGEGLFLTEGAFLLQKSADQAWKYRAKIYWDDTAKECTTRPIGVFIGFAQRDEPSGVNRGVVELYPGSERFAEKMTAGFITGARMGAGHAQD